MDKEIRIIMRDWTPYVPLSNAMTMSAKLTIVMRGDLVENEFEAKTNLQMIRTNIRSPSGMIGTDELGLAEGALRRLRARENESVSDWAEKLGKDISSRDD